LRPVGAAGKRIVPSRGQGLKTPAFGAGALLPLGEKMTLADTLSVSFFYPIMRAMSD
jgi:hypothetical protein